MPDDRSTPATAREVLALLQKAARLDRRPRSRATDVPRALPGLTNRAAIAALRQTLAGRSRVAGWPTSAPVSALARRLAGLPRRAEDDAAIRAFVAAHGLGSA